MNKPGLIQVGSQSGLMSGENSGDRYPSTSYPTPKSGSQASAEKSEYAMNSPKPVATMPGWLKAFVEVNPVSLMTTATVRPVRCCSCSNAGSAARCRISRCSALPGRKPLSRALV